MKNHLTTIGGVLALAIGMATAGAQVVWDGDLNGNWNTGDNWQGNVAPAGGDALQFAGSANTNTNNDTTAGTSYSGITFDAGASAFNLDGNGIVLGGNIGFTADPAAAVTHVIDLDMQLDDNRFITTTTNGNVTVNGVISDDGNGRNIRLDGTGGTVTLTGVNTFAGQVQMYGSGTLSVDNLADKGVAGALGSGAGTSGRILSMQSANSANTFVYTGGATSTDKDFRFGIGAHNGSTYTIDNQGSGSLAYTNAAFNASVANNTGQNNATLTFTGVSDIEVDGVISNQDNTDDLLTVEKTGTNTLQLDGANTFGGGFEMRGGRVNVGDDNALGADANDITVRNTADGKTLGVSASASSVTIAQDIKILETGIGTSEEFSIDVASGQSLEVAGSIASNNLNTQSFRKTGDGELILSGTDTDTGGVGDQLLGENVIAAGSLALNGDMDNGGVAYGSFTIQTGAAVGGSGTWGGDLTLDAGAEFLFSLTDTLTVLGSVTLDGTFGIDDLIGIDGTTPLGTYTLIDGTSSDFSLLGIENFGSSNAFDLGGGKSAYFQNGSLQVVVIPEPSAGLLVLGALGVYGLRRRRKA